MHVMECRTFQDIRQRYKQIFNCNKQSNISDIEMLKLMNGDADATFWRRLANFIISCKKRREDLLLVSEVSLVSRIGLGPICSDERPTDSM